MRVMISTLVVFWVGTAIAQEKPAAPAARYGVSANFESYPQTSAKQALQSIAKALERDRLDYILAHLADPAYVDEKVQALGGKFPELVREFAEHLTDDAKRKQELIKFLTKGEVAETGTTAKVTLKDVPSRQMNLKQVGGRWYLLNDDAVEKKK